jgi:hypothetical protein
MKIHAERDGDDLASPRRLAKKTKEKDNQLKNSIC